MKGKQIQNQTQTPYKINHAEEETPREIDIKLKKKKGKKKKKEITPLKTPNFFTTWTMRMPRAFAPFVKSSQSEGYQSRKSRIGKSRMKLYNRRSQHAKLCITIWDK